MRFAYCQHKLPCRTNMWTCGLKTKLAHAVTAGDITMDDANRLLAKYGEHPLLGKAVYTGKRESVTETLLEDAGRQYLLRPLP